MSETILRQTTVMLMLIMVGVLCSKTKLISKSANRELSGFDDIYVIPDGLPFRAC